MGGDLVVHIEQLEKSETKGAPTKMVGASLSSSEEKVVLEVDEKDEAADEDAPLIGRAECRICQDEDSVNNLETPCVCNGSLKYAHRVCVQHWCNEKGDTTCEICHQPYQPGYVAPPRNEPVETVIDIGGGWHIAGTPINVHDPRLLAIAEAERQFMESDYDSYNDNNASGASFLRLAALILMALLLMRHAVAATDAGEDDDSSAIFSLFLLRVIGFLFPCYIMVWAITVLQRRRQQQEAAAAAAVAGTPFTLIVQSRQHRGIHLAIARPAPPPGAMPTPISVPAAASMSTPQQEQV
ncbi:ubiquitin-protein ligase [Lithospermum erythrorhizon]|uniref:Ubiquitin-protein ligase n=1 Tax=Lithospermum erythrorhizon TaxID=34254 RepID=A0AAV3QMC6_LITER